MSVHAWRGGSGAPSNPGQWTPAGAPRPGGVALTANGSRRARRGAARRLQLRHAVHDGTLGAGSGRRLQAANDPRPPAPIAA